MKNIAIIGAGAAGLMTAATILENLSEQNPPSPLYQGGTFESNKPINQQTKIPFHLHLFDKNPLPGTKVALAGGGRCNLTTGIEDKKLLLSKYTRGSEFIRKALGKFSPRKCQEWFESHGIALKTEGDSRVFPASDDGRDVVEVFENIFAKHRDRISFHYGEPVSVIARSGESVSMENNATIQVSVIPAKAEIQSSIRNPYFSLDSGSSLEGQEQQEQQKFIIITSKGTYESDIIIITTGGNAYAHTGSSGDGYAFARSLGHTITQLGPSLSSFLAKEKWMHELSGLAFENARIAFSLSSLQSEDFFRSEKISERDSRTENDKNHAPCTMHHVLSGPILLTHFGISGPLTFQLSSHLAWEDIGSKPPLQGGTKGGSISGNPEQNPPTLSGIPPSQGGFGIHFSPISQMNSALWNSFLKEQFQLHPKKLITSILIEKLPRRFAEAFVREYFFHIDETFAASISRDDREKLAKLLGEGIPLTLLERRAGDEFVTAGGVDTDEVNPETMESRIQKNLYFAGEVLNIDAVTGGFNLQACWAGGYSAGKSIVENIIQTD